MINIAIIPRLLVNEDCSVALNVDKGEVVGVPDDLRIRLHELADGPALLRPSDIGLLERGLVTFESLRRRAEDEDRDAKSSYLASAGALAVMPTEKCNFRCTYCYETFEKGRMSQLVMDAVCDFLDAEVAKYPAYDLAWFGGEPLLQPGVIKYVTESFWQSCEKYNTAGSVSITTNGSLLDHTVAELLDSLKFSLIQISLDGPEDLHNQQRPALGSSKATYGRVLAGITAALQRTSAKVIIRFNVQADNDAAYARVCDWLRSEMFPEFSRFGKRVIWHAVPIWEATTTSVGGICLTDLATIRRWERLSREISALRESDWLEDVVRLMSPMGELACYAGKPGHFVVGADGTLYKCTVAFDLEANRLGSVLDLIPIDMSKDLVWTQANALTDSSCGACSLSRACLGLHCPLTRIQEKRRPCPSIKPSLLSQGFRNAARPAL